MDRDYQLWSMGPRAPRDAFENQLTTLFEESIGRAATSGHLRLSCEPVDGKDICRIDVIPSRQLVFVKNKEKQSTDFYVRMYDSTRALTTEDALTYITGRQGLSVR